MIERTADPVTLIITREKQWETVARISDVGRSRIIIRHLRCGAERTAYLWSFAGHGKTRCVCGEWLLYGNASGVVPS